MKPIIRWTIGGSEQKSAYEILNCCIHSTIRLYSDEFDYFVCFNDVKKNEIKNLEKKYKNVNFIRQNWYDCPLDIKRPKKYNHLKQKLNGSFWKICPARLNKDTHEIILDNDLILLKRPKIFEEFLSRKDKNLIIQDCLSYLGSYKELLLLNENQGYNSGVIGLAPGYDFSSELAKNWHNEKEYFGYDEEQGLLMYTLLQSDPLIGSSEDFVGIFPEFIYLNSLSHDIAKKFDFKKNEDENKDKWVLLRNKLLKEIFKQVSVVHFLTSNRQNHDAWKFFKRINLKMM